jgi:hypothetical protein
MKQEETSRQIDTMKKFNVIQESDRATKWGQMLLVPKPNGKWRFVSDHDTMNQCSEAAGWPIPNIPVMLQRIGSRRAKFYGIMDLTSGYHQAPLSWESQVLTAFITFMGVFEYLRVPMGIKGAAAYFQQVMATFVLVGLVHIICECYQDDILTYGETEEEFEHLLNFVREAQIDRAGCFAYSPVKGALANELPGMLPQEVREERRSRFMAVAEEVSVQRLQQRVGATMQVLVDKAIALGKKGGVGRSYADAPEIDGVVKLLPPEKISKSYKAGELIRAKIVGVQGHDLIGLPI